MKFGASAKERIVNDQRAEQGAACACIDATELAYEVNDQASVDVLIKILTMEEDHGDWGENQRSQI